MKDDLQSFASDAGLTSTEGFQFPLLDDPAPVLSGILTGQPKDMFTFSTGREHFDLSASVGVGIPGRRAALFFRRGSYSTPISRWDTTRAD